MIESVVISYFDVESEGFQALSELKEFSYLEDDKVLISQVALLKKASGKIILKDSIDTGKATSHETLIGTVVGGLVGILAGPLGVLLGVGLGGSIGLLSDTSELKHEQGLIQGITKRMKDGDVAIVAVVQENEEAALDQFFGKFKTNVKRYDASEIQEEIDHAKAVQKDLERHAQEKMNEERSEQRKAHVEEYRHRVRDDFNKLKDYMRGKS